MKSFTLKVLRGALLAAGTMLSGTASASLTGTQTATIDFTGMGATVFGKANTADTTATFQQANTGTVVGIVKDPTDLTFAHLHRNTALDTNIGSGNRLQYHPDSTGIYVRLADQTKFSLQSFAFDTHLGQTGGNFKIYGFQNAINDPLLGKGTLDPNDPTFYLDNADPEGGLIPHIAEYTIANNGSWGTINLAQLTAVDANWGNIGAFWITFQGFNNSPNTHYWYANTPPFPAWDFRIDDIVLGAAVAPAAVPVPGAAWLFGTGLLGLIARGRHKLAA